MFQAIVFDLDGTLIDSAPDVRAALNRLLAAKGRRPLSLAEVQDLVGEGARPLIARAWVMTGAAASDSEITGLIEHYLGFYRANPADHTIVFAHVRPMLERLQANGYHLGICTNKPSAMTEIVLNALDLRRYFRAVLGGDHPRRKPDGDHILETLRQMAAPVDAALYVGDSRTDVLAARNAGVPVIAVTWGYARMPVEQLGADILIDDFRQLEEAMTRVRPCASP